MVCGCNVVYVRFRTEGMGLWFGFGFGLGVWVRICVICVCMARIWGCLGVMLLEISLYVHSVHHFS